MMKIIAATAGMLFLKIFVFMISITIRMKIIKHINNHRTMMKATITVIMMLNALLEI